MGASRRRILLMTLKVIDLSIMTTAFLLAALPVSREVSFAEFLSMRIKVENLFVFPGYARHLAHHFCVLRSLSIPKTVFARRRIGVHSEGHLGEYALCGSAFADFPHSDDHAHLLGGVLASHECFRDGQPPGAAVLAGGYSPPRPQPPSCVDCREQIRAPSVLRGQSLPRLNRGTA